MTIVIPDGIEPVMGWRAWSLSESNRLVSPSLPTVWTPRRTLTAVCKAHGGVLILGGGEEVLKYGTHVAPNEACSCGLHMVHEPFYAADYIVGQLGVIGRVAGWGKVIPAAYGHRVQYAYPQELYVLGTNSELVEYTREQLQLLYGIPVETRAELHSNRGILIELSEPNPFHASKWRTKPTKQQLAKLVRKRSHKERYWSAYLNLVLAAVNLLVAIFAHSLLQLIAVGVLLTMAVFSWRTGRLYP